MRFVYDTLSRIGLDVTVTADMSPIERDTVSSPFTDAYRNHFTANAALVRFRIEAAGVADRWTTKQ